MGLFFLLAWPALVRGDGGTICIAGRAGEYQVTVFAAPNPIRAGPVDVSFYVQDATSGEPATDVRIRLRLTTAGQSSVQADATREAATNKLFHSAKFELPAPGVWHAAAKITGERGPARAEFDLSTGEALPPWTDFWFWITMPVLPVAAFAAHQVLTRRANRVNRRDLLPGSGR